MTERLVLRRFAPADVDSLLELDGDPAVMRFISRTTRSRAEIEAEVLPFCARENIGVIAYSPMASGLLTGAMTAERIAVLPADDWRKRHPDFREPQLHRNLLLVRLLRAVGRLHGRTPAEAAVAWVLHNPAVTGAIVGARRPDQVRITMFSRANSFEVTNSPPGVASAAGRNCFSSSPNFFRSKGSGSMVRPRARPPGASGW